MSYKKFKLGNKTLKIKVDSNAQNPRSEDYTDCNLAQVILFGKHKSLGDKHNIELEDGYDSRQNFIENGAIDVTRELKRQGQDVVAIKPVHLYEHSGSTISTEYTYPYNCRWDSGTAGFVVITKQRIREMYCVKNVTQKVIENATEGMLSEIQTLDDYIRGEVYGFVLKEDGEEVDSCWGFYGNDLKENGILDYAGEEWRAVMEAE